MSIETVNSEGQVETTQVVADTSVQNQTDNGTGAAAENTSTQDPFARFKEFGVETPDDLYTRYADLNQKVPTLEQKIEELSKADPFATPAGKLINDYERALIAQGVTDPKEIARASMSMRNHLETNYTELAASDPSAVLGMRLRNEADAAGMAYTEESIQRQLRKLVPDASKFDMDDPDSKAEYDDALNDAIWEAQKYAAQLEKDKQALDFTPRVDPVAQAAAQKEHEEKQAKYQKLVERIAGYQIPESINIGGRDIPITKTPELIAMLKGMESRPLDPVAQFLKMDGEIPDFDRAVQLAMLIHHLPQIVANYEAKATDAATRALEGGLHNSQHTGSGQGGGASTLTPEEQAKKAIAFLNRGGRS